MWSFRHRNRRRKVDTTELTEQSAESLARATDDLAHQRRALRREQATLGERYNQIVDENHLADLVYQAFTRRHGEENKA